MDTKLKYCQKKLGNSCHCSNIATRQIKLCSKKEEPDSVHLTVEYSYRCEQHKYSGTSSRKVFESNPLDQSYELQKINNYLKSLIGKRIRSKFHHTTKELEVKYIKDNAGIMCLQPITNKWKYVYYNQIDEILI